MLKKIFLIFVILLTFSKPSFAEKHSSDAIVDADKVFYNKKLKKVIAQGNVEIYRNGFIIKSNKLELNKDSSELRALGNVVITEPNGEVFYGKEAEIINNLKTFVIYELLTKVDDKITIGAHKGVYSSENKEFNISKASVTTCQICPGKKPQWQFNSRSVKYDTNSEMIYHKNSFFEIYGIPVFYTPFLSHLSPNAKVKSGFLFPSYQYNNFYGNGINLNYYYRINEHADLTFSPIVTEKQGVLYQMNYRQLFRKSKFDADISYNEPKKASISSTTDAIRIPSKRYFYDINFSHIINDKISVNSKFNRVSDKSFLRNYYNKNKNFLTSSIETKYQDSKTYGEVKALHFQGLRKEDESARTPEILPIVGINHQSYYKGNIINLDGNFLRLNRSSGVGVSRFVMNSSLERTYYIVNNLEWSNILSLRGDHYRYMNIHQFSTLENNDIDLKKKYSRTIPSYQTNFSYPLISSFSKYTTLLQPIVQFIASPHLSGKKHIINEDSLNIEITDSNLFSNNRYSGYDMFESGARVNYGVVGTTTGGNNEYYYMIGQAYRFKKKDSFSYESGWKNKSSDVVGHIGATWSKKWSLFYKYRIDPNLKNINRNEVEVQGSYKKLSMSARYIKYNNKSINNPTAIVESAGITPRYQMNKNWSLEGRMERNASKEKSFMVSSGIALLYDGECLWSKISASKDYTSDYQKNVKPSVTVSFDFILKGLQ